DRVCTPGACCSPCTVTSSALGAGGAAGCGAAEAAGAPVPAAGGGGGGSGGGGWLKWGSARVGGEIGLASRGAGGEGHPAEARTAADAKGSAPDAVCAERTEPSAFTTTTTMTLASPRAPSG